MKKRDVILVVESLIDRGCDDLGLVEFSKMEIFDEERFMNSFGYEVRIENSRIVLDLDPDKGFSEKLLIGVKCDEIFDKFYTERFYDDMFEDGRKRIVVRRVYDDDSELIMFRFWDLNGDEGFEVMYFIDDCVLEIGDCSNIDSANDSFRKMLGFKEYQIYKELASGEDGVF